MKMKRLATFAAAALYAACACAGTTAEFLKQVADYSADVAENGWYCNLSKAQAYAIKNKMPLVVVWSNGDACGHCVTFENACKRAVFKNYVKESGVVWVFGYTKDGHDGARNTGSIYKFAYKNQTQFPLIRIYWPAGKVDVYTKGDDTTGGSGDTSGAKKAIAYFKSKLSKYVYTPPSGGEEEESAPYRGGGFAIPGAAQARLEAEPGATPSVEVPLVRTNETSIAYTATNLLVAAFPGGTVSTNTVLWAAGERERWIDIDTTSLAAAGDSIALTLLDGAPGADGAAVETSLIAASEAENSPKNPLWLGERTAETLAWGEWTMDLDAATNKTRAANAAASSAAERAFTMVLIGGSMWCPDCAAADLNCFDREEFKEWAASRRVALVAIDIPNDPTSTNVVPSLLSYAVNYTSARYWTCNYTPGYTNEDLKVQSGACYLSRHGISRAAAAEVAARNAWLVGHDTLEGGWNRPERAVKRRTGVPVILVLRDDGTVAARFNEFSDVGPTAWSDGFLKRFDEMLAAIDEPAEEANDHYLTTGESISARQTVSGRTLSFSDAQDVYALDAASTAGKRLVFTAKGSVAAQIEVKVLSADGVQKAYAAGSLADGVSVGCEIEEEGWFVSVGVKKSLKGGRNYPDSAFFAHTSSASGTAEYALRSDFTVLPAETVATATVDDALMAMTFALVSNETYRITGLDASANGAWLAPVEGRENFWKALATGDATLSLASLPVEYQLWRPGKVGFALGSAYVQEGAGEYLVRVVRTGGVSGSATFDAAFDSAKSSSLDSLFELPDASELSGFVWNEGESGAKTFAVKVIDNGYADGDQKIWFSGTCGGDAEAGVRQFALTIRDNDRKVAGKLAISGAEPAMSGAMRVVARAGGSVAISLSREGGFDGAVSATLKTTAGTFDTTKVSWAGRETDGRSATLDLSGVAAGVKAKVTLVPAKGSKVNAKRRVLTVETVAATAPGFAESAVAAPSALRYVAIEPLSLALDGNATSSTKVKLCSGALPPGLKWKLDSAAGCVRVWGVPSKAGSWTACFRAWQGKTAGTTCALTFDVADAATTATGDDGAVPANTAVAVSRTFPDVLFMTEDSRLAGILTLTMPRSGKMSAKYRTFGADGAPKAVSLSCASWSSVGSDGAFEGTLSGGGFSLVVRALRDGTVALSLSEDGGTALETTVENLWSKTNQASDFQGYYTVSLPRKDGASGTVFAAGRGYACVSLETSAAFKNGKATVAGILPDGKEFSCKAALTPKDRKGKYWMRALLPLYAAGADSSLCGAIQIAAGAADSDAADVDANGEYATGRAWYKLVRRSVRPAAECALVFSTAGAGGIADSSGELDVFGGYYDAEENFEECCETSFGDNASNLRLFALSGFGLAGSDALAATSAGAPLEEEDVAVAGITVKYAKASSKAKVATNTIKSSDGKLSFDLATGIVAGTFSVEFEGATKTVKYAGVVMPGWGSQECGDCGLGGVEVTLAPFISGAAWFDDVCTYVSGGASRTARVRRSCPVTVGVNAGE